jgi:maleate isomerase
VRLPFETDSEAEFRAAATRLGLIVLQSDEVIETEFRRLLDLEGVSILHSRVPSGREVTPETLTLMEAELPAAVRLLPPGLPFDVVAYACTSGSTVIGEARVAAAIHQVIPGVAVSNPLSGAKAALKALGLRRIGFVTPYVAAVSGAMRDNLVEAGFEIGAFGSFEVAEDGIVARMTPACILAAILRVGAASDCEGVFVSCTNLRTAGILEEAEARLGKPVVTSNQALAWHMLRLAGRPEPLAGRGRLFTLPLS